MLTNKNAAPPRHFRISSIFALLFLCLFGGCQPAGPKALLLGEKYINQGEYEKALRHLTRATVLIPEQPQVWNHLGLAYHGLKQPVKAAEAYQRALRIDRNMAAPHYNLGVLYLEEQHLPQAASELSAFISIRTNFAPAYVKIGTALLRMKRPDDAERAVVHALRLDPKNAEAYNLLGLTHVQRKRPRDAIQAFNNALKVDSNYAPAVLNQAIVAHQYFADKDVALERYRTFLSTKPDELTTRRVEEAIRSIEREIAGPEVAETPAVQTNQISSTVKTNLAVSHAEVKTNIPAASPHTNLVHVPAAGTNVHAPVATNLLASTPRTNAAPVEMPSTNIQVAATATNKPAPAEPPAEPEEPPISVEVVRVEKEPTFKVPTDATETKVATAQPGVSPAEKEQIPETKPLILPRKDRKEEPKVGILSRVNPARWFRDDEKPRESAPPQTPAPRPSYPPVIKEISPTPEAPRVIQRYKYRRKIPLVAGNRAAAEKLFQQGAQAHQQRRLAEAMGFYRDATVLDPTYFEAHYNLALVAYRTKNLPLALAENELAVVTKPSSADARYNFALALRDANYPADAAAELSVLVDSNPDDVRAQFSLANIYAEQLDEPIMARRHYLAVLEVNPAHPQASAIRQWLAAHP